MEYGVVERIELFREGGSAPTGLGAILGAAGGVIGHQIGSGTGNTAAIQPIRVA
jgi:outer membrane lipoprotein SlyB